jgi:hypothetical protein
LETDAVDRNHQNDIAENAGLRSQDQQNDVTKDMTYLPSGR